MFLKKIAFMAVFSCLISGNVFAKAAFDTDTIRDQGSAQQICPQVCMKNHMKWDGRWLSVPCSCVNQVPEKSWCGCVNN
jgi:hypothetical protein